MKIKKLRMMALVALAVAAPSAVAVPYYNVDTVGGYGPYQTGQGGEFTLHIGNSQPGGGGSPVVKTGTGVGSTWSFYDVKTRDQVGGSQPSFQTFCVEGTEDIYANTQFDATTATSTKAEGHTLTVGAAWIYSQFASGQLAGYNYGANRTTTAGQLQQTIWWLMGTEGYTQTFAVRPLNPFTTAVLNKFSGTDYFLPNGSQYGVAVLRLWADGDLGTEHLDSPDNRRQDQLVLTGPVALATVPDGGLTITLLGLSLGGIAVLRRWFQPPVS